ncbi:MAG: NAD(P)-dependent oxidoreductase [Oligoflexales bacterium]|nr:NAD(P)-dependent oxidoreductase [Oligoflexales bacterium]
MEGFIIDKTIHTPTLRLVITGATGFVGQALLRQLRGLPEGSVQAKILVREDQFVLDDDLRGSVEVIKGELPYPPSALCFKDPFVLIHFGTKQIDHDKSGFERINVEGTRNLLKELSKGAVGYIYGSSMSVYGSGSQERIKEDHPLNPKTDLAKSRKKAEDLIMGEAEKTGRTAYILRPRFVIGHRDRFTLNSFLKLYQKRVKIGSGDQIYSFMDVDDYASIIFYLAQRILDRSSSEIEPARVLNVGYSRPLSYNEIMDIFKAVIPGEHEKAVFITISDLILNLSQKFPFRLARSLATKLDLVGFSHCGDVRALETTGLGEITGKDPREIFKNMVKRQIESSRFPGKGNI